MNGQLCFYLCLSHWITCIESVCVHFEYNIQYIVLNCRLFYMLAVCNSFFLCYKRKNGFGVAKYMFQWTLQSFFYWFRNFNTHWKAVCPNEKEKKFYKNLKINYQKVVVLIAEHLKVEIVIKMLKCNPIHYSCERISWMYLLSRNRAGKW